MGLSELFSDLYAALGVGEAVAEAPSKDDDSSGGSEAKDGDAGEEKEDEDEDKEGEDKEGDKNEAEGGEEDEEEDDEPVDPKPKLEEGVYSSAAAAEHSSRLTLRSQNAQTQPTANRQSTTSTPAPRASEPRRRARMPRGTRRIAWKSVSVTRCRYSVECIG